MEEEEEEESCQSSKTRGDADGVPGAREKEGRREGKEGNTKERTDADTAARML